MDKPSGQTGIRLREALAEGDAALAATLVPTLDRAHRVELLLGAALRDARGGFAAAKAWLAAEDGGGDWGEVCRLLAQADPDTTLDELASAYVAARRAPERWAPEGAGLDRDVRGADADVRVAAALVDGVAGLELVDAFADHPLHPAVSRYYRVGTLHALGVRPLLVLAAASTSLAGL